jgi:serine/threonine protein kinase
MGVAKLCDFGWAAHHKETPLTTFCGTLDYLSPEMKDTGEYSSSVDTWSIGVMGF